MDSFDNRLKERFKKELHEAKFSKQAKQKLKRTLVEAAEHKQKKWHWRFLDKAKEFLETTFEISLVPVAAAMGLIIIAVNLSFVGLLPEDDFKEGTEHNIYYVQQISTNTDGTMRIVYEPITGRDD